MAIITKNTVMPGKLKKKMTIDLGSSFKWILGLEFQTGEYVNYCHPNESSGWYREEHG